MLLAYCLPISTRIKCNCYNNQKKRWIIRMNRNSCTVLGNACNFAI